MFRSSRMPFAGAALRRALVPALAAVVLASRPAPAQELQAVETKDLRLVHPGGTESFLIPHVGRTFLNSLGFQRRLFDYEPWEKTTVLLTDFSDQGNAGASAVPRDFLGVQIAPLGLAFETMPVNERMNTIMNHELVHVATMDRPAGSDRFFRRLFFGKVSPVAEHPETILYLYLTAPRVNTPRWYLEGIAVFVDTWMAGGFGRAQSGWDEMVFRSMVRDDARFYDPLGLVAEGTKIDFQTQVNSYLYGGRFMTWLAYQHSPEKLIEWVTRKDGRSGYYSSAFRQVFGTSLDAAWRQWVEFEKDFQGKNLAAIRQFPRTPSTDISPRALGSISRPHLDAKTNRLYAGLNYPGTVAHLGAISLADGSVERLVDIKGPTIYTVTSLAWEPESRTLFYTTDNLNYRDLVALDPDTRKKRVLMKDARIGDLALDRSDRSLLGIRHFNGICTLVRMPAPYTDWKQIHSWPYGEVVYDIDVSPDGKRVSASFAEISGRQTLRVWDLERLAAGDATPLAEKEFAGSVPSNFVFSPDGKYLFGSAFYTGVSNIFRYELATGELEAVTNTETGFFRPLPLADGSLIAFRYSGAGFVPARVDPKPLADVSAITFFGERVIDKHPVLKSWQLGSPAAIPFESLVQKTGPYGPIRRLRLESAYPVVQGYKDFAAAGWALNFTDPAQLSRAAFSASYTPDGDLPSDERLHLAASFQRYDWRARLKLNSADFYDLFGPTKTSRRGYSAGLGYKRTLIWDEPRELSLSADADFWGNLEQLPFFQNVPSPTDKLLSLRAKLAYRNVRGSMGKVDEEKGARWELIGDLDQAAGQSFPKLLGSLDLGRALPIPHSSVFLRSAAAWAWGDRESPLSSVYLGGFGNNWVDHQEEKRYREWYAFPGKELNEIAGHSFARTMLEWNLPPARFRRAGTPGFYFSWARPALFASVVSADFHDAALRRTVGNAGAQVDFQLTVLSALDLTFSVGYAFAFEDGLPPRHETMVSLKVLR
jgi:hypothetical protein